MNQIWFLYIMLLVSVNINLAATKQLDCFCQQKVIRHLLAEGVLLFSNNKTW